MQSHSESRDSGSDTGSDSQSSGSSTVKQASSTASSGSEGESGPTPLSPSTSQSRQRRQLPKLDSLPSPPNPATIVPPSPVPEDPSPNQRGPLIGQIHLPGQPIFSSRHRAFEQFREWERANWEYVRNIDAHTRWEWYIQKKKLPFSSPPGSSSSTATTATESVSDSGNDDLSGTTLSATVPARTTSTTGNPSDEPRPSQS
ncbi:hypothetical protein FRC04_010768 [Tulasnella sp. 424]|nr:hypothetical protein FRC04_010768 [Tulasnella sp. 424]KAG8969293.1 hypothetical protein FRC05_001153 [Tulasnella sp. 425]